MVVGFVVVGGMVDGIGTVGRSVRLIAMLGGVMGALDDASMRRDVGVLVRLAVDMTG